MSLHRLNSLTLGIPDVAAARSYYEEFGLTPDGPSWLTTKDGGRQLEIVAAPTRRLVGLSIGVDDTDDLERTAANLKKLGIEGRADGNRLLTKEPVTGVKVEVAVTPRLVHEPSAATLYNWPGRDERAGTRAPGILREGRVRPRKLGHVVIGSVDQAATQRFFTQGVGLKISDEVKDVATFMRCSTDHHNIAVNRMPANFVHHTSWQVDDVDEVGRGAMRMLDGHPERHVWGPGRHYVGSNFFWYLKDPAGNFVEYYSDLDTIVDDALWEARVWDGPNSLYSWGPPPPEMLLAPEDLAALIAANR